MSMITPEMERYLADPRSRFHRKMEPVPEAWRIPVKYKTKKVFNKADMPAAVRRACEAYLPPSRAADYEEWEVDEPPAEADERLVHMWLLSEGARPDDYSVLIYTGSLEP